MPTLRSRTVSVSIECPPARAYDFLSDPENLPRWAGGFCISIGRSGEEWVVATPQGPVTFRFVERNGFGVLDHTVRTPDGTEFFNPMRVFPNGSGCELAFTLFRTPGMADAQFDEDAALVERDLNRARELLENRGL